MPQYMLLLHGDPANWNGLSPDEMQKLMLRYRDWLTKPFTKDGKRLADEPGRVMRRDKDGKIRTTDGPYSETKEVLGGYYTIEAASYDEAVKLALEHPQLDAGGTIEVREVWSA